MAAPRRSIRRATAVTGIGLHTGRHVTLTFQPAPARRGVAFHRTDLAGQPRIPARLAEVLSGHRRTVLGRGDATVETVEHVLAAVAAHGIDDLDILLDGPEPPAGDGSAAPFFDALAQAGQAPRTGSAARITLTRPITVRRGSAVYHAAPASALRLTVTVEWDHPAIGRQTGRYEITTDAFRSSLAAARTFGFAAERAQLVAAGLARGASPANAIVLTDTGIIDADLRWPDEFVRHKAVDLLGDLALLGGRLAADISAERPSHHGNLALARAIDAHCPEVPDS